jgi:murein DD-endopeptidase MepM/ murein hydrolase activator NlpD
MILGWESLFFPLGYKLVLYDTLRHVLEWGSTRKFMSRRIPKRFTILISLTGKMPVTLYLRPKVLVTLIGLAIALPSTLLGGIFYSQSQKNKALVDRNNLLTEEAAHILEKVEFLETEIQDLQERAGMPGVPAIPARRQAFPPQGGLGGIATPEDLLSTAKAKLPNLMRNLKGRVQPALEQTLEQEAARPRGVPLKVRFEISSLFGLRRNPFGRGYEFHYGMDFTGAYGTPIHVTAPGVVEIAEFSQGYGYHVIVNHGYGYRTLYAHMSKILVKPGIQIERDRIVGYLGNTGRSSGPHLHYSVYRNEKAVDPQRYID